MRVLEGGIARKHLSSGLGFSKIIGLPTIYTSQSRGVEEILSCSILAGDLRFDAVIPLMACADMRQSCADPWVNYVTNIPGASDLLGISREHSLISSAWHRRLTSLRTTTSDDRTVADRLEHANEICK